MGTTCMRNNDPRFKTNQGFYEAELINNWNANCKVIDYAVVGKTIYELIEKTDKDGEKEVFISTILISRFRGNADRGAEICYKYVDESMGPTTHDCPVKFLNASTCQGEYAVAWRERCRGYRKAVAKHKKDIENIFKKMPRGAVVEMVYGDFIRVANPNHSETCFTGYRLNRDDSETLYRWRYKDIKGFALPDSGIGIEEMVAEEA